MTRTAADRPQAEAGAVPWRRPRLAGLIRDRAAAGTGSLFSHGAHPLARTLNYPGDPGLFGPGSMTWPVAGDTAVFVGGIRALLVQAAHPEVAAGVAQHSRYRQDPWAGSPAQPPTSPRPRSARCPRSAARWR